MTLYFANHSITIIRRRRKGSSDRYGMSATFTAYQADIQPADAERVEMAQGRFGATFTGFVEANVNIKVGDYVQTEDGKRYAVKGVQVFEGSGLLDHIELLLTAEDG